MFLVTIHQCDEQSCDHEASETEFSLYQQINYFTLTLTPHEHIKCWSESGFGPEHRQRVDMCEQKMKPWQREIRSLCGPDRFQQVHHYPGLQTPPPEPLRPAAPASTSMRRSTSSLPDRLDHHRTQNTQTPETLSLFTCTLIH